MLLPQAHLHAHAAGPEPPDTDFVFTVETTGANETFQLGCANVDTYNGTVDWGDGQQDTITAYNAPELIHQYANAGIHEIRCSGTWPGIQANVGDQLKWKEIKNWGDINRTYLSQAFYQCSNLSISAKDGMGTGIWSIFRMFSGCPNLGTFDGRNWDASAITSWNRAFEASGGQLLVDNWDTNGLASGLYLFFSSDINDDLSAWNFDSISNTTNMFVGATEMSSENTDNLLQALYNARNNIAWASPTINISSCGEPTGVYQDPQGPPTSGKEIIYVLENDPDAEGFNTWSITY